MFAIIWENINKYSKLEQKIIKDNIPYTTRIFQEDENKFMFQSYLEIKYVHQLQNLYFALTNNELIFKS